MASDKRQKKFYSIIGGSLPLSKEISNTSPLILIRGGLVNMVLYLPAKTGEEYERNLARFITTESALLRRKITFIDCRNSISHYLFSRTDLEPLFDHLFITRIDRPYDLLDLFRSLPTNTHVQHSHYVIVSPFEHLLEKFSPDENKNWHRMWEKSVERLEQKQPIHVVVMSA